MNAEMILTLVSLALGLIATILGGRWITAKGKLKQFKNVIKEGYDVVSVSIVAIEDDKITKEEVEQIKQEGAEFKAAFKLLMAKESA